MCCLCMITVILLIGGNRKRNWEELFDVDYACIKNIMFLMKKQFIVYRCTKLWKDLSFDTNYNFLVFRCTRSKFSKVLLRYHTFLYIYKDQHGQSRISREKWALKTHGKDKQSPKMQHNRKL